MLCRYAEDNQNAHHTQHIEVYSIILFIDVTLNDSNMFFISQLYKITLNQSSFNTNLTPQLAYIFLI